jgi:LysM repeat protein
MTTSTYSAYDQVTVRRVVFPRSSTRAPANIPRMRLQPIDSYYGGEFAVPYSPREIEHNGIAAEYATVNRAGRKNALVYQKEQLATMSFTLFVADKYKASASSVAPTRVFNAQEFLAQIRYWARNGVRLKVTYGWFEAGTWRITELRVRTIQRGVDTNHATQAEATITMTQVVDIVVGTGPVSGGVKPAPAKKPPAPKTRTYTVKKGDTLIGISIKYYGTGSKWRRIADANKIKNVKTLQIGRKLKIP